MMRIRPALWLMGCLACTGASVDVGTDGDAPPVLPCVNGFEAEARDIVLPSGMTVSDTRMPTLWIEDLDADGRLDLLVFPETASSEWQWYRGMEGGFEDVAAWSRPVLSGLSLDAPSGTLPCPVSSEDTGLSEKPTSEGQALSWTLLDMTGDRRIDLLVTDRCDNPDDRAWQVYQSNGSGFVDTPTRWALPDRYGDTLNALNGDGSVTWRVVDLDGDRLRDLVVLDEVGGSALLGTEEWYVHLSNGSRFAETQVFWDLPQLPRSTSFKALDGTIACGAGQRRWDLMALDDEAVDLVLYGDCDTLDELLVYRNDSVRFAPTPTRRTVDGEFDVVSLQACGDGHVPARLLDLEGDDDLDVLGTGSCTDPGWSLAESRLGGFAERGFSMPDLGLMGPDDTVSCGGGSEARHLVIDVDGDGQVDLLRLGNCADPAVGAERWEWHKGTCAFPE